MKKEACIQEDFKKALSQIKQMCDFMLDDTGTVEFSTTAKELDCLIDVLASLRETALLRRSRG